MISSKTFECPECGDTWEVCGYDELGGWFPFDDKAMYCECCGKEGDEQ